LAKAAFQCSADTLVVNQSLVLRNNICGETRHLRQARKRWVQTKKTKTMRFSKINLFNSNGLFTFFLFGFLVFLNSIFIINAYVTPLLALIFVAISDLFVIGFIILGLTTKVTITDNGIIYKSVFKKIIIDWIQIKSFGVYVTGRNVKYTLDKVDYNKFIWADQKFIFITDKDDYTPAIFRLRPKSGFTYFDFHYRQEAMQMIEDKMINIK
jgi:hypothetical protein